MTFTFSDPAFSAACAVQGGGSDPTDNRVLSGWSTDSQDVNGSYAYAGLSSGKPSYSLSVVLVFWNGSQWVVRYDGDPYWTSSENVATPELVTSWTPVEGYYGAAGTITV